MPGVAEFAASYRSVSWTYPGSLHTPELDDLSKIFALKMFVFSTLQPISNSPPKWMADLESEDIEMLKGTCCFCRPDTGFFRPLVHYVVQNFVSADTVDGWMDRKTVQKMNYSVVKKTLQ